MIADHRHGISQRLLKLHHRLLPNARTAVGKQTLGNVSHAIALLYDLIQFLGNGIRHLITSIA